MINIKIGDCRHVLKELPSNHFYTCVTSPPYWGLRDYGNDGQLGLEETPQEYVDNLVKVFKEVKRVLRDDGTVWLNLGDSYNTTQAGNKTWGDGVGANKHYQMGVIPKKRKVEKKLKPKDLVGIPWRVAFALQEDGWYLRQDIIWHKPNPMPESVKDRCTKAHEYIFLLSKSKNYYFDNESIRESIKESNKGFISARARTASGALGGKNQHNMEKREYSEIKGANKRSVWTVTTKPYKEAHFATYPPNLIEPCILAGCPENGNILDPFGGSGTTGLVADRLNRNATIIELNKEYIKIADKRITNDAPLFTKVINS
jgi:DNA modification methylase